MCYNAIGETMNKNMKKEIIEYLKVIGVTLIVTSIFLYFVQISRVVGESMLPNYHDGNIVLVNKQFYSYKDVKYGDVIVANVDFGSGEEQIIKRVIGKQGDTISLKDHILYRNNQKVNESYIKEEMNDTNWSYKVNQGEVFVMGDNRNNSSDSRVLGPLNFKKDIVGKVFFKVF